ncbi:putative importin 13 [Diaporthe ampelina]|uniref:Putative importin 13 n=1 Tax=Diaporthe ampelina TaxID=1214573 RepID=A0A0G2I9I1_9PEZI|nr:putative importin 13 [Diaporthe ampelina]
MEPQPLPSNLDEAESLILALYRPAPPEVISRTQDALQRLQRSQLGWQFAHGMLERPDDQVKFFGALTIIIKLNTESSALAEDDARQLLQSLIGWLVRSLADGSGALVIRKLASALVTFFIHFPRLWPGCVHHLLYCFDAGRAVPRDEAKNAPTSALLANLDETRLMAAIWFITVFVEEIAKTEMKSQKYLAVHESLAQNSEDVTALLACGLSNTSPSGIRIREETIKCLQSWILYEQRLPSSDDTLTKPLRNLIIPALECIQTEELTETTMELFIDILQNYSGFLRDEHYEALFALFESDWSRDRYMQLSSGDFDFAFTQYGILMIAFGDAKVQTLMEGVDERSQRMLQRLCGLLNCSGILVGEDKIFVSALEFWATFVETLTDTVYMEEVTAYRWLPFAMSQVMDAISHCYGKIQLVGHSTWSEMDSNDRAGWIEARKDVADFLLAVWTLKGKSLVTIFVDLLLQALPAREWARIEASLFCLGAISDCIGDSGDCDQDLHKVFSSELFQLHCLRLKEHPHLANEVDMKSWIETRLRADILSQKHAPTSVNEAALIIAERVLRGVASMARGMQSLSEAPIDLDAVEKAPQISNERLLGIQNHIVTMVSQIHQAFGQSEEPDNDPDLTQSGIDFLNRIMSRYPEALLQLQPTSDLEFFFMFALRVLDGKEPLPKGSACDFWSAFVSIKSDDASVQAGFSNALEHLGPLLTRSLVQNIGGNASRSELDKLSDPLKKLVVQHPRAKQWLEAALLDPSFPSTKVTAGDKLTFVKKITK